MTVHINPPQTGDRWIPANDFIGTGGTPAISAFGGGTSVYTAFLMDAASQEQITATRFIPADWTTFAVDLWWTNQAGGAGDVRWQNLCYHAVDGGAMATLDRTGTAANVTAPVAATIKVTALDTAVPNVGGLLALSITRIAADAGDTLANDAAVVGVNLRKLT